MPLVRGGYTVNSALRKFTGGFSNVVQPNLVTRSNHDYYTAPTGDTAAIAASGTAVAIAIPVEVGDVISRVSVAVGATAAVGVTSAFAAVYSGVAVPALLTQSVASGNAINASALLTFQLVPPVPVTLANAPFGFLYVSVVFAATTLPSLGTVSVATGVQYKLFPNSAMFAAATHGSALSTTAPSTIVTPAPLATVPVVYVN